MVVDTRALSTLETVIRRGSFAAAARELGFTPSAVSQQMFALERRLSIALFDRRAKMIVPTEAALHLRDRADEVLTLLNQIEIDIARLGAGQLGRLRVGTFDSAGGPILGQAMARFLVRRREVEITLDEGEPYELFPRVADGSLDVALGFKYDLVPPQFPDNLLLQSVTAENLYIVASDKHRLLAKDVIDFNDLADETWVAHRSETASYQCLSSLCGLHGFSPRVAFRSNNLGTVQGIVAADLGLALIPEIALRQNPNVTALSINQEMPKRHIVSARRKNDNNPLTDAFIEALRAAAHT